MIDERDGDKIRRDGLGRPYIQLPDGSKEVAYTRASTFAKALSDGDRLSWWRQQMLVRGIARDGRTLLPVLDQMSNNPNLDDLTNEDTKQAIAETITRASDVGGANDAATWGTTLHHFADLIDFTDEVFRRDRWDLQDPMWEALDSYVEVTKELVMLSREQFVVNDELRTAGSYDRTVEWEGQVVVADLKTGAIRFPDHAIQLAVYANSQHYDIATGKRVPGPVDEASKDVALIVQLPRPGVKDRSGKPERAKIVPVDIAAGWELAHLAEQVRKARNAKLAIAQKGK